MHYRLVILTHYPGETLTESVESFERHVSPSPSDVSVVVDGPEFAFAAQAIGDHLSDSYVMVFPGNQQRGFCEATQRAWREAIDQSHRYVFYLEHDFVLTQDVDLRDLAEVLDANQHIAQMALMRDAVNSQEILAGGLYESRRDEYEAHDGWLEHRSYFTTNPSLMRRTFMVENPWPEYPDQCEGKFGIDLLAQGFTFGVWGDGQPWCKHVGARTGFGY